MPGQLVTPEFEQPLSERAPEMSTLAFLLTSVALCAALCHVFSMLDPNPQSAVLLQSIIKGVVIGAMGAVVNAALRTEKTLRMVCSGLGMLLLCLIASPAVLGGFAGAIVG